MYFFRSRIPIEIPAKELREIQKKMNGVDSSLLAAALSQEAVSWGVCAPQLACRRKR